MFCKVDHEELSDEGKEHFKTFIQAPPRILRRQWRAQNDIWGKPFVREQESRRKGEWDRGADLNVVAERFGVPTEIAFRFLLSR